MCVYAQTCMCVWTPRRVCVSVCGGEGVRARKHIRNGVPKRLLFPSRFGFTVGKSHLISSFLSDAPSVVASAIPITFSKVSALAYILYKSL
jgi:hypothetical protein